VAWGLFWLATPTLKPPFRIWTLNRPITFLSLTPRGTHGSCRLQMLCPAGFVILGQLKLGGAWYNDVTLDSAALGIQSSTSPYVPAGLLTGQYCASLQYGEIFISNGIAFSASASIAQSGQIPTSAKSMIFRGSTARPIVSFEGHTFPVVVLNPETDYNVYAVDISPFAGQTGELRFTSTGHFEFLDEIQFSPASIPELSSLASLCAGVLLVDLWLAFRRARPNHEKSASFEVHRTGIK
jgi:hypothetical protein